MAQQCQGLREPHLVIKLGKANHIAAAATTVAVEQVFAGIHQEAWFVISMQRAQPHLSATAEGPRRVPIMRLQIAHQGNLPFQIVEILAIHGLLASISRIRQTIPKSQATMVDARKKCSPTMTPAFTQQHTLSRRRCAHRRRVDGSGECDGSLQCGAACSTVAPAAMFSQACCRQRKVKGAEGASQSGKIVKVLWHGRHIPRRAQMRSWRSSWAWRSRCPWPMIVSSRQTGHRLGRRPKGITPGVDVVFRLWQCDKENHGWHEGPPLVLPARIAPATGLHPPGKDSLE